MLQPVNQKYFKLAVGKLKKDSSNEIVCNCPMCGDQKNRLHLYSTEVGDLVHCFNDGCELSDKHHSVRNFLDIINSSQLPAYKRATLSVQVDSLKEEQSMQSLLERVKSQAKVEVEEKPKPKEIPLQKLFDKAQDSEACMNYLYNRGIEVQEDWFFSTQKFFEYNGKHVYLMDYLLIPIYDEDYKYRGFYSRSIKEKSFSTFLQDGTEKIWRAYPDKNPEIICEGIFDAISSGFDNSAAMLSANVSEEFRQQLPKSTIFAFDNDETGIRKAIQYSNLGFKIFVWPEVPEKDFNEMLVSGSSKEEIKKMIQANIYDGILAKVRLKMKER